MKRGKHRDAEVMGLNLGQMIEQRMKSKRLTQAEITRKLGRNGGAIYPILRRPSMQAYLLWEVSIALEYNYFRDLADALDKKAGHVLESGNVPDKEKIAALEKELSDLKESHSYLKKAIDMLSNKA